LVRTQDEPSFRWTEILAQANSKPARYTRDGSRRRIPTSRRGLPGGKQHDDRRQALSSNDGRALRPRAALYTAVVHGSGRIGRNEEARFRISCEKNRILPIKRMGDTGLEIVQQSRHFVDSPVRAAPCAALSPDIGTVAPELVVAISAWSRLPDGPRAEILAIVRAFCGDS
jgi:hypothetical protein